MFLVGTFQTHGRVSCQLWTRCYQWAHLGHMSRLHSKCEQDVPAGQMLGKVSQCLQCAQHFPTKIQVPSPPVSAWMEVWERRMIRRWAKVSWRSLMRCPNPHPCGSQQVADECCDGGAFNEVVSIWYSDKLWEGNEHVSVKGFYWPFGGGRSVGIQRWKILKSL